MLVVLNYRVFAVGIRNSGNIQRGPLRQSVRKAIPVRHFLRELADKPVNFPRTKSRAVEQDLHANQVHAQGRIRRFFLQAGLLRFGRRGGAGKRRKEKAKQKKNGVK